MKDKNLLSMMIGRDFMIRPILFIFFLASSCAYIDYKRVPGITKDLIFGKDDIIISQEFFEKAEYSFVKVRFGKDLSSIFVLSSVGPNNDYTWISSNFDRLVTRNGKVIKIISDDEISFRITSLSAVKDDDSNEYLIEFKSPSATFLQLSKLNFIDKITHSRLNKELTVNLSEERVTTNNLKWDFTNKYLVYENKVIHSEQYIHPNLKKVTLDFYYKY